MVVPANREAGTLGAWVCELRSRTGLSQESFAAVCNEDGVSQSALSRWERNGAPGPSHRQVAAIVRGAGGTDEDVAAGLSRLTGVHLVVAPVPSDAAAGA